MWSHPETTYVDSLIYRSDRDYPALVNYNRSPITYFIVLEGRDTSNDYTLFGSFSVENDCSVNDCRDPNQPTISLLDGGRGLSNRATMNNGEFQVEGYCGNAAGRTKDNYLRALYRRLSSRRGRKRAAIGIGSEFNDDLLNA